MKKHLCTIMVILLGLMFLLVPGLTTLAQDKVIELTYSSPHPPGQPFSEADKLFFAKIEKETNGRVKFKPYWSGTLVSAAETLKELATGVVDMACISPHLEKSGFDVTRGMLGFFYGE